MPNTNKQSDLTVSEVVVGGQLEKESPIFICHNSEVSPEALALCIALESRGYRTWTYEADVPAGSRRESIEHQMISKISCGMIVILSSSTINHSQSIIRELTLAGVRRESDKNFRTALYSVGISYNGFRKGIEKKQRELHDMIAQFTYEPLQIDCEVIVKDEFDVEQWAESDPFAVKLFTKDIAAFADDSRREPDLKRIAYLQSIYRDLKKPDRQHGLFKIVAAAVVVAIVLVVVAALLPLRQPPLDQEKKSPPHLKDDRDIAQPDKEEVPSQTEAPSGDELPGNGQSRGGTLGVQPPSEDTVASVSAVFVGWRAPSIPRPNGVARKLHPGGDAAEYAVEVPVAGEYALIVPFANDQSHSAPPQRISIMVNGQAVSPLVARSTGEFSAGWDNPVDSEPISIGYLAAGTARIVLKNPAANAGLVEVYEQGVQIVPYTEKP